MESTHSFGYWVRRQRKALDLTQAALARQVGCAAITIRKIEGDQRRPSRQMAERLADSLAIPSGERQNFIESGLGLRPVDHLPLAQEPIEPAAVVPSPTLELATAAPGESQPHPFVGRQTELTQLGQYLESALSGEARLAFIVGEAGRGKTALLAQFARQAQRSAPDLIVIAGSSNAFTGSGDPYLPFSEAMRMLIWGGEKRSSLFARHALETLLLHGPNLIELFVPTIDLRGAIAALDKQAQNQLLPAFERLAARPAERLEQQQILAQVADVLEGVTRRHPLLILLDDLQWIDPASANLLFHLGRRLSGSRVLLIGAYRPSEVALDMQASSQEAQSHLAAVIQEFRRRFGKIEVNLEHFASSRERQFADALLDIWPNRLDESFRIALFWRTKGHPLFTLELLREMQQRGDLVQDETGHWIEGNSLDWETLPARVEAVIAQRLARLDKRLRQLLSVASVEGETFTAQIVAHLQKMEERVAIHLLSSELQRRHGLVREQGEMVIGDNRLTRYQFDHALFQQYLYNDLGQAERRLLHAEFAAELEALRPEGTDAFIVPLAHHYAEAGNTEKTVYYLLRAGDQARTIYAHQEAAGYYRRAIPFLTTMGDVQGAAQTWMKLGLTYHIAFDFERARHAYDQGFALWKQQETTGQTITHPPAPHPLRLVWQDPPTLDPMMGGNNLQAPIVAELFSGLVAQSPGMEIVPDVAYHWQVLDGGRTYVFHLRRDATWSDGVRVSAADFVYTFKRALDPAMETPVAGSLLYPIRGARDYHQGHVTDAASLGLSAPNDTTLVIELEEPNSYFLQELTYYVLMPVPKHVVESYGAAWAEPEHIVTNGPFRLLEWQPGQVMHLERNPDYHSRFGGNIERVTLALGIDDTSTQVEMYQNEELDIVYNWFFAGAEMETLLRQYPDEYTRRPRFATLYLFFNVSQPPFDDRRLRRALAMALDREAMARTLSKGYDLPGTGGFLPPGMPGYSAEAGLPYDPEQARQLLAEAGYPAGRDFPAVPSVSYPTRASLVHYLCAQWQETLGVEIRAEVLGLSSIFEWISSKQPGLAIAGWWADYADPENFLRVCVEMDVPEWHNEAYERLLERARCSTDQAERIDLYRQADRLLMEEAVLVPLTYSQSHLMLKPWVKRFPITAIKNPGFWKDAIIEPH